MERYRTIEITTYGGDEDGRVRWGVVRSYDDVILLEYDDRAAAEDLVRALNTPVIQPFAPSNT